MPKSSQLADVFPKEEIITAVPGAQFAELGLGDLPTIASRHRVKLSEIALTAWDYAMSSDEFRHIDPTVLGEAVDQKHSKLLVMMERVLGRKLLVDIWHVRLASDDLTGPACCEATLAHVYPNRLHLADISLLDPARPRQPAPSPDQSHESLRLFKTFLKRAEGVARRIGAQRITLTAANSDLYDQFQRYGFQLADTRSAPMAVKYGAGIPMTKLVPAE